MRFRFHRGSLDDSMKTQTIVNSIEELVKKIEESHTIFTLKIKYIRFEFCKMDERIGWNTYYVIVKYEEGKMGYDNEVVEGMSDGMFPEISEGVNIDMSYTDKIDNK